MPGMTSMTCGFATVPNSSSDILLLCLCDLKQVNVILQFQFEEVETLVWFPCPKIMNGRLTVIFLSSNIQFP